MREKRKKEERETMLCSNTITTNPLLRGKRRGKKTSSLHNDLPPLLLFLSSFFFAVVIGNVVVFYMFPVAAAVSTDRGDLNYTRFRQVSSLRLERIHRHLNKINKTPVLSIQSPDGDIIDCIHRRKQLALYHPLLKNHKIQKAPSRLPEAKALGDKEAARKKGFSSNNNYDNENSENNKNRSSEAGVLSSWQTWHDTLVRCPKGTIPVRRSSLADVLRAKSLFDFGKKPPRQLLSPLARPTTDAADVVNGNGHEHAIAYIRPSTDLYGAKATINVWDPSVQVMNEFSLSQIWVLSGSFDGSDLNSIEAGWQVSPELYGDSRPRLFVYWTSDAYQATGCYNLLCSGFVQTNDGIAIGAAISPVSMVSSNQYDITILIWKDPKLGNWWMSFGEEKTLVGYWPKELFTHLSNRATMVQWGGEVVNTRSDGRHTSTQMGSGRFAGEGFGKASYFRNLEIVDSDNSLSPAQDISTIAENTSCYDILNNSYEGWGTNFFYGGPGQNPSCQ